MPSEAWLSGVTAESMFNSKIDKAGPSIVCQSLGSRPILVLELFTVVPRLFGTTSRCLSVQPVHLLPSRNIWRHISLIWSVPHRYRHSPWPVDVTELFHRFCCWTLIWLSRHWAWFRRGYRCYRSFIDWLIDWLTWMGQREIIPKRRGTRLKCSCTYDGGDRQTNSFAWTQWTGWESYSWSN